MSTKKKLKLLPAMKARKLAAAESRLKTLAEVDRCLVQMAKLGFSNANVLVSPKLEAVIYKEYSALGYRVITDSYWKNETLISIEW